MNDIERRANRMVMGCAIVGTLALFLAGVAALMGSYVFAVINAAIVTANIVLIAVNLRTARLARR